MARPTHSLILKGKLLNCGDRPAADVRPIIQPARFCRHPRRHADQILSGKGGFMSATIIDLIIQIIAGATAAMQSARRRKTSVRARLATPLPAQLGVLVVANSLLRSFP